MRSTYRCEVRTDTVPSTPSGEIQYYPTILPRNVVFLCTDSSEGVKGIRVNGKQDEKTAQSAQLESWLLGAARVNKTSRTT